MSIDLNALLDALGEALQPVEGLRVYPYPADRIEPPAAVIGLPVLPFDFTMQGGSDQWQVPVWIIVSNVSDRASRTALCDYVTPDGPTSVKAAIEFDKTLGGTCDTVRVTEAKFTTISVAATEYLAAEFTCEVVG